MAVLAPALLPRRCRRRTPGWRARTPSRRDRSHRASRSCSTAASRNSPRSLSNSSERSRTGAQLTPQHRDGVLEARLRILEQFGPRFGIALLSRVAAEALRFEPQRGHVFDDLLGHSGVPFAARACSSAWRSRSSPCRGMSEAGPPDSQGALHRGQLFDGVVDLIARKIVEAGVDLGAQLLPSGEARSQATQAPRLVLASADASQQALVALVVARVEGRAQPQPQVAIPDEAWRSSPVRTARRAPRGAGLRARPGSTTPRTAARRMRRPPGA